MYYDMSTSLDASNKLENLLLLELDVYKQRTKESLKMYELALQSTPTGVSSCYQCFAPYPFYIKDTDRASVIDVDGNSMIDFHGGYGVTLFGYKNPYLIEKAMTFLQNDSFYVSLPSMKMIDLSNKLAKTFGLPYWRYLNSGTEATLDAIRLARARTNTRPYIIKVESGYHGHHDTVWVSVHAGEREMKNGSDGGVLDTDDLDIPRVPFCTGIPTDVSNLTLIAEYNNIDSVKYLIKKYPNLIAGVIVEPILLNCSMIKPKDGFLQKLIEISHENNMVVIFDLVKINTAINIKHVMKYWSHETVGPDMYTLGKGLAGGACPVGAIGMTREFATIIEDKRVQVSGTYNGNSYALSMMNAVQDYVTEEKQAQLESISRHLYLHCKELVDTYKMNIIVDYIGNKGCITFLKRDSIVKEVNNYQDYIKNVDLVVEQLYVLYFINRGLWVQARDEWSISYQHTMEDANLFIQTFASFLEHIKECY